FYPTNEDTLKMNVAFFEHIVSAKQDLAEQKNRYYYFKFRLPKYKILQWIIEPLSFLKKNMSKKL
ncbi:MAG: hypothetical protein V1791_07730, partial [Pseudomonadota bacterium]